MEKKSVIKITVEAANYIASTIKEADESCAGLRINIKSGGCSGHEYIFDYAKEKSPADEEVEAHGIKVFIAPTALLNVIGSTLDYQEDTFSEGLIFTNPNETAKCGCGKSISF